MLTSGVSHAISLAILWPLSALDAPSPVLLVNGLLIGATMPPTGLVLRSAWSRLFPDERRRRAAFATESLAVQSTLLIGPLLVSVVTLSVGPGWGLVYCAGLTLPSSLALGTSRMLQAAMRPNDDAPPHWAGALQSRSLWLSLPAGFGLFAAVNAMEITAAAQAINASAAWAAGWLIGAFAVGGLVGGVAWGWRSWPGRLPAQLIVLQGFLAAMLFVLALNLPLIVVATVLLATGVVFPPAMTAQYSVLDITVPRDVLTESFGWLGAARQSGSALAGGAAGFAIDSWGLRGGWLVGGIAAVLAVATSTFLPKIMPPVTSGVAR
jgi:hypothetical protein